MHRLLLLPALAFVAYAQTPRPVGKPVSALPASQATPEGAYAAIAQAYVKGADSLAPLFPAQMAGRLPKGPVKPRPEPMLSQYTKARVDEVVEHGEAAAVLATLGDGTVDLWFLQREGAAGCCWGTTSPAAWARPDNRP